MQGAMVETSLWLEIESLYRSGFGQFLRVARAITGDPDAGVEAVQEGFADALRNVGQWKGRGPLEAWVWRCVVNRARKSRRRPAVEAWGNDRGTRSMSPATRRLLGSRSRRRRSTTTSGRSMTAGTARSRTRRRRARLRPRSWHAPDTPTS